MTISRLFFPGPLTTLIFTLLLTACAGPVSMVASSVISAAVQTGIETAQKNRADPEKLWQQYQLAQAEQQAIAGNADAQFQLGIYYLLRREAGAAGWICQAANQGHALAQLQFGHLFNEDRKREDLFPFINLGPNDVKAFVWYSLATKNGQARAQLFKDSLKRSRLNSKELHQAQIAIQNWRPQPCTTNANLAQQPNAPLNVNN